MFTGYIDMLLSQGTLCMFLNFSCDYLLRKPILVPPSKDAAQEKDPSFSLRGAHTCDMVMRDFQNKTK